MNTKVYDSISVISLRLYIFMENKAISEQRENEIVMGHEDVKWIIKFIAKSNISGWQIDGLTDDKMLLKPNSRI